MPNTARGFEEISDIIDFDIKRNNHLFAIAIDDYEHCPKLANAVKDVTDFIDIISEKYDFQPENIKTLFNQKATEANILKQFETYATNLTDKDNLIIYFSGHGEENKVFNEGYWIPTEAQKGATEQYIPNSLIRTILSSIKTHHTFLISDSCFSGTLFSSGTRSVTNRLERDPSRWGLSSGRNEVVSDGNTGENSPFATSLLYCLKNNTKPLGVQELCASVLEMTATNAIQTPLGEPLKVEGHRNGQFVFHLKMDEISDWERAKKDNNILSYNTYLKLYPKGQFIKEAQYQLLILMEDKEWEEALTQNTIIEYFDYHKKYPTGKYAEEALKKIAEIEEEEFWANATRQRTLNVYNTYLVKYPNGKYLNEANEAVNKIMDEQRKIKAKGAILNNTNVTSEITQATVHEMPTTSHFNEYEEHVENVIIKKNMLYWKIAASATWFSFLIAAFGENHQENFFLLVIFISLLIPFYVAYQHPIKNPKIALIYLFIAYGLLLLCGLIDIFSSGAIFQNGSKVGIGLLAVTIPVIFLCHYLNKYRYPIVMKKEILES